jgi:hypothetical protein
LLRLDRLHPAIAAREEDAGAARRVLQRESPAIRTQAGVALDEFALVHPEMCGHPRDLGVAELHLPRPAAALGAAHALVVDPHRAHP